MWLIKVYTSQEAPTSTSGSSSLFHTSKCFRPERAELSGPSQAQNIVSGTINHIERVGDSSYLYVETSIPGAGLFIAKVSNYAEQSVGQPIHLRLRDNHLHVFDDNENEPSHRQSQE